jgi:hypothetical protein
MIARRVASAYSARRDGAALGFVTQITLALWLLETYSLSQSLSLMSGTLLLKGST